MKRILLTLALFAAAGRALAEGAAPLLDPAQMPEWAKPYFLSVLQWLQDNSHDEMSPIGMFMAADWVVKAVMLSLLFASFVTWVIFAGKMASIALGRASLRLNYRRLDRAATLNTGGTDYRGVMGRMVRDTIRERDTSAEVEATDPAGIRDRTSSLLSRIEAGAARRMSSGTGVLANIGSTAPFVGLFGTVWGIMNSFVSIAESQTTNLAVVAPGIAEALLATAIGLVAAIPAVIFYNLITRALGGYKIMLGDAAALVERTLSRDLDRAAVMAEPAEKRPVLTVAAAE